MGRHFRSAIATAILCVFSAPPAFAQDANEDGNLFRKLIVTLVRDVKELPSRESRQILVNGVTLALASYPLDDITTLGASSSTVLKATFSGWGKALGREWVQGGAALATYVGGRLLDQPTMTRVGGDLIEAQIFALSLTQGVKFATQRTRPDGEGRSFPSGHASAAFATATVLHRYFGGRKAAPAYAMAVYTSMSRLQANSHFASDIMFGAALGVVAGRTATIEIAGSRLHMTAVPVRRGASIIVTAIAR